MKIEIEYSPFLMLAFCIDWMDEVKLESGKRKANSKLSLGLNFQ